jgi:hypothetical protein
MKGSTRSQIGLGALESARGGSGKMIESSMYHCIKIMIAPKTAAAKTDVTEYLSSAGNDANGFQYCAVLSNSTVHKSKTVHLAQFFIVRFFRAY